MTERLAPAPGSALAAPEIRQLLERFIHRRVPACEVDDLVQTVLCAALGAPRQPADHDELRRWLLGIARHKVTDYHRAARRRRDDDRQGPEPVVEPAPYEARALARWAERATRAVPLAEQTLEWMAREGDGEPLAAIAAAERLPAPRVRQRVWRLRRALKRRWLQELALALGAGLVVVLGWYLLARPPAPRAPLEPAPILPVPSAERAQQIRRDALRHCEQERWHRCVAGLDRAKQIDPTGDQSPQVRAARARAAAALAEPPVGPSAPLEPTAPSPETPTPEPTEPPSTPTATAPAPRPTQVPPQPTSDGYLPPRSDSLPPQGAKGDSRASPVPRTTQP